MDSDTAQAKQGKEDKAETEKSHSNALQTEDQEEDKYGDQEDPFVCADACV